MQPIKIASRSVASFVFAASLALSGCFAGPPEEGAAASEQSALSALPQVFPLPTANSYPGSIVQGPDGALWFLEAGNVARITASGAITEFAAPIAMLSGTIATGPDGNLWIADPAGGNILKMTTKGAVTRFPLPGNAPRRIVDHPQAITLGPDGALWFTVKVVSRASLAPVGAKIGRITTAGAITEITLPTGTTRRTTPSVGAITTGHDGALWFTDSQLGTIDRITTEGALTTFPVPFGSPLGIAAAPDGNIWFTAGGGASGAIGRLAPSGALTAFTISGGPNGVTVGSSLAVASDGAVWTSTYDLTTSSGSAVRLSATGAWSRIPFATFTELDGVTATPDGSVWFSVTNNQTGASSIDRFTSP